MENELLSIMDIFKKINDSNYFKFKGFQDFNKDIKAWELIQGNWDNLMSEGKVIIFGCHLDGYEDRNLLYRSNGNYYFFEITKYGATFGERYCYYPNCILASKVKYHNGIKHGLTENFSEYGKKEMSIDYKNGARDGLTIYYNDCKIIEAKIYINWVEIDYIEEEEIEEYFLKLINNSLGKYFSYNYSN